ncbi:hypothetical protein BofuT4_P062400.1 [Botrytis cinerea T4]|uniref:Uncharacterized protein n=1 Tax=Botryotinia fuckeliana (strain T4) TaxID=999810 RepID=G2XTH4_BOTF4|nr:hypothetical protein BofuT4_P062400.1 [Botrytis cinerea T4]
MDASGEAKRYVVLEVYEFSILNSQFSIDGKASRENFITEFPIILSVINLQLFTATVPYDKKLKRSREQCHESAGTEVVLARSTERDLERYSESKVKNSTG